MQLNSYKYNALAKKDIKKDNKAASLLPASDIKHSCSFFFC